MPRTGDTTGRKRTGGHREWPAPLSRIGRLASRGRRDLLAWAGRRGLVEPLRWRFGLREIRRSDLFLVSYPRSGNTWMRFILGYLIRGVDTALDWSSLERIAPDIYKGVDRVNSLAGPRIIKIHEPLLDACPRVVYVHRDPREALVSYWFFVRRLVDYREPFSRFLRGPIPSEHGSWKEHLRACRRRIASGPDSIHVIAYRDLRADFAGTVGKAVSWSGLGEGVDLEEVRKRTTLPTLAAEERRASVGLGERPGRSFFADIGEGLDWRSHWSAADLAWLARDRALMRLMDEFGYGDRP